MANEILKTVSINGVGMDMPGGLTESIVESLPQAGTADVIYLVANGGSSPQAYDKYVWVNGAFEVFG